MPPQAANQAHSRRQARVEKQYTREISDLLYYDETVAAAVNPAKYFDDDDHVFVEVTDVLVSGDLQVAKVYVHVTAETEEEKAFAVRALQGKAGYMRKRLAQRISLRRTPELRILYDESIDEMERVDRTLAKLALEREAEEAGVSVEELVALRLAEGDGEWEDDGEEYEEDEYDEEEEEEDDDDEAAGMWDGEFEDDGGHDQVILARSSAAARRPGKKKSAGTRRR